MRKGRKRVTTKVVETQPALPDDAATVVAVEPFVPTLNIETLEGKRYYKAVELFVQGLSRPAIAVRLKCPRSAVERSIKEAEASGLLPRIRDRLKRSMGALIEDIILERSKRPGKVSVKEATLLFDKWQLLEGEPTSITEQIMDDRTAINSVVKKLREFAASAGALVVDSRSETTELAVGQLPQPKETK